MKFMYTIKKWYHTDQKKHQYTIAKTLYLEEREQSKIGENKDHGTVDILFDIEG
jgi:hypothetical protein